jgi:two-component system, chemotaxis family, chemotaxis protein CheY
MNVILVVEDSALVLKMLSTVLREKGFEVVEARNADEALGIMDGRRIDLVITDLIMPGMDGIELATRIRNMCEYRKIPILIQTTQSNDSLNRRGEGAGITGWISKPFHQDKLVALIRRTIVSK